ncbi:MAG: glycerol-3-phosphate acyltransferase [Clostridia bacterium]|nr:glycerol-3-phosphate acyltransferase [Clostridia bacterium]
MKEISFSGCWYWFLLAAAVCYLVGCFNFAVLISHIKKKDIRNVGSGNPGTMNMTRTFGLKIGGLNFLCDVLKGGLPALAGYFIFKNYVFAGTDILVSDFARYFFGVFAIIGHVFPVTMKFKGGKGIASTMGLFLFALPCEQWWYAFVVIALLLGVLLYIALTEWGSMGSLLGVSGLTIIQAVIFVVRYENQLSEFNPWVISMLMILLVINLITWLRHSTNIYKLVAGEEHHTAVRKHKKSGS